MLVALATPHSHRRARLHITVSIGIVTYPDDGTDAETLLNNADFAMYHAKDNGRDNYQFFKPEMNVRAIERQSLEDGLRPPWSDRNSCCTTSRRSIWRRVRSWASRRSSAGAIRSADWWLLCNSYRLRKSAASSCRSASGSFAKPAARPGPGRTQDLPPMRIAVNVSAVELRAREFVADVCDILTETGLEPRCLELELTETFLMQDSKSTAAVLQASKTWVCSSRSMTSAPAIRA